MPTRIVLYPALATVLAVAVCTAFEPGVLAPSALPAEQQAPTAIPTEPVREQAGLEAYLVDNPSQENLVDVFARNLETGEVTYVRSLEKVPDGQYYGEVLHQGSLYIIRRQGDPSTDEAWTDELWRYSPDGQAGLLFSGQAIGFLTASDENLSAITYYVDQTESGSTSRMAFVRPDGSLVHEISGRLFFPGYDFQPLEWTGGGSVLWAALVGGPRPMALLRVTPASWRLEVFDLTALSVGEYDLNPEAARLAFSDYPFMFDADAPARLQENQTPITLWVLDLETQELRTIATTIARPFAPTWLSATTLEYNHPEEEGRIFTILE